jgi:hypothetical protein
MKTKLDSTYAEQVFLRANRLANYLRIATAIALIIIGSLCAGQRDRSAAAPVGKADTTAVVSIP